MGVEEHSDSPSGRKYVISASRRTDLVACQPDRLASILSGESKLGKRLRPEHVHTLLISTKDFRPLLDNPVLRQLASRCDQVCINLTITGFGGTELEPRVPTAESLLARLPELAHLVKDARRITWCYDPVFTWEGHTNIDETFFTSTASHFANLGCKRVMAMFYFPYRNAWIAPELPPMTERKNYARRVTDISRNLGMDLSFCHVPGFHTMKCVDLEWYCFLHPQQDKSVIDHYRRIKKTDANYCRDAVWDVGWYLPPCRHGCLYCYAIAEKAENSTAKHNCASGQPLSCLSDMPRCDTTK